MNMSVTMKPTTRIRRAAVGVLLSCAFHALAAASPVADTILNGGKIFTVDASFSVVESLAIRDGRVLATGSAKDMGAYQGPDTRLIELAGKTVIPGLIDNHLHFVRSAWNYQNELRLDGIYTRKAALAAIANKAKASPPGSWIITLGGWSPKQFRDDSRDFTLAELDAAAPQHPVYLLHTYSSGYANTAAFAAAGVTPPGNAKLQGREGLAPFTEMVTWRNETLSEAALLRYMGELNRVGLTTVYDVGRPSEGKIEAVAALAAKGPMPLRVFNTLRYSATDAASAAQAIQLIQSAAGQAVSKDTQAGVVGLGEHLYTPMLDNVRLNRAWADMVWTPFSDIVEAAAANRWPIHEHIMTEVTAAQFVDLVEKLAPKYPQIKDLRWTMAHVDGMSEKTLARARDQGLALAVHSQSMMKADGMDAPLLGSIERSGILWGLGSDASIVAPYNRFTTLAWAITGRDIAGAQVWSAEQRLSRQAALRGHTINNAKLLFVDKDLGSLEPGKLADLLVLDGDLMTVADDKIEQILPLMTMSAGRVVFSRS